MGVRLHAEQYPLGIQIHQATGSTPGQGRREFLTVVEGAEERSQRADHLEETGRRRRAV